MKSMIDEDKTDPRAPRYIVCPCCKMGFKELNDFEAHAVAIKAMLDNAIAKEAKRK